MRMVGIAFALVLSLGTGAVAGGAGSPRFTRCCVDLGVPEVPGPVCAQVRSRRGIGARRACRLIGGTPIGRGDCSLAACRPPTGSGPGMMGRSS
jgi:hypothetical protein